jgi:hypothetical protein
MLNIFLIARRTLLRMRQATFLEAVCSPAFVVDDKPKEALFPGA